MTAADLEWLALGRKLRRLDPHAYKAMVCILEHLVAGTLPDSSEMDELDYRLGERLPGWRWWS